MPAFPSFMHDGGFIFGTEGNDVIWSTGPSMVFAGAGDDGLRLSYDPDLAWLGTGNDVAYMAGGNDMAFGGEGDDFIYAGTGHDWVEGGDGNDMLNGSGGNDQLYGNAGDDLIYDEEGNNALFGSDGNDVIQAGSGNDVIFGGADNDLIRSGDGNDWLSGGSGNNEIAGQGGDDVINAGRGDNLLFFTGDDGTDTIKGFEADNDQLVLSAGINGSGIASVSDMFARVSASDDGESTIIDLGGGEGDTHVDSQVLLDGVDVADVQANLVDYFDIAIA